MRCLLIPPGRGRGISPSMGGRLGKGNQVGPILDLANVWSVLCLQTADQALSVGTVLNWWGGLRGGPNLGLFPYIPSVEVDAMNLPRIFSLADIRPKQS